MIVLQIRLQRRACKFRSDSNSPFAISKFQYVGFGALALLCLHLLSLPLYAAKKKATPPNTTLFPAGAQAGTTSTLTLSSKMEGTPGFAIDCPGVFFIPQEKGKVQCIVAPDAPHGLHLVSVFTDAGVSDPRWFSIGTLPEITEKEPNHSLRETMAIDKLPVCINGRLDKRGAADLFSFALSKGQTLCARVEAYALGSLADPELELRDDQGTLVASAHDARNLDPVLLYTAPRAATYAIQIAGYSHPPAADVNFVGGDSIIYRLQLTNTATTLRAFPAAVSRKQKTRLELRGTNMPKAAFHEYDASTLRPEPAIQRIALPNALTAMEVIVADVPILTEAEPNNDREHATKLGAPACIAGRIESGEDADCFAFDAKKGSAWSVRVHSRSLGLPLNAHAAVLDASGKELATSNDSTEFEDAQISFKAPADGNYMIKVTDLFAKGGADAEYVLRVLPAMEDFDLAITSKPVLSIEAGKTLEIKAKVKRLAGYSGELVARAQNLPAGVMCADVDAPKKDGAEITLKLEAAANAPPGSQPVQIALWTKPEKDKPLRTKTGSIDLRGDNRRGTSMLDSTGQLWLTVTRGD